MSSVPSSEESQSVRSKTPCRPVQLHQLAVFYNKYLPSPPILVSHGLAHTGKLGTILSFLKEAEITHALVRSRECLSQRHLLTKVFAGCVRALGNVDDIDRYERLDSLNALLVNLQKLFRDRSEKFVLVLDGIDKQRGATYALLPALARLGDEIPALSVILTSSSLRPLQLHRTGVPYIHFAPYMRNEAIQIVISTPPPLQPESLPDGFPAVPTASLLSIYKPFVAAVYDTLITHTSSTSLPTFRRTCERLWPRFIWPMLAGEPVPTRNQHAKTTSTWDFARLLVRNRALFQSEGEQALLETLTTDRRHIWTFNDLLQQHTNNTTPPSNLQTASAYHHEREKSPLKSLQQPKLPSPPPPLLKFFPALLLLSSYLASHTQPKHDIILFSRLSSSSSHKRRYLSSTLNRSRVRKTPTKPKSTTSGEQNESSVNDNTPSKKRSKAVNAELDSGISGMGTEKEKTHRSSRLLFEKTSSIPRPFTLERVIAILRAIHPDGIPRGMGRGVADKVYVEMAELERLRLVIRASGGGEGGSRGNDEGVLEEKWRVNVDREVVVEMGKSYGIGVDGWEID